MLEQYAEPFIFLNHILETKRNMKTIGFIGGRKEVVTLIKYNNEYRYPHFISANTQVRSTLTSSSLKRRHRHSSFYTVQWIISFAPTMMSFCC